MYMYTIFTTLPSSSLGEGRDPVIAKTCITVIQGYAMFGFQNGHCGCGEEDF